MHRSFRIIPLAALSVVLAGAGCSSGTNDIGTTAAGLDGKERASLPNWATDEELAIQRQAPPPAVADAAPPPSGYRVPAEYEPVRTVVMTYAAHTATLRGIAVAAAAAGADVWMVGGPASISGVPSNRYRALDMAFDTVWSRDYGPVGIHASTSTLGIVDTTYRHYSTRVDDDAMSCELASELGSSCYKTSLILDGGNYMTDGRGNAFLSRVVYDWNNAMMSKAQVDALLKSYLGATTLHIFDYAATSSGTPADGTGHIDMFAKLIGDCKVIVAQATTEPYKTATDKAASYFANLACGGGRYQVTRVKGWSSRGTWYTYTNSLIVNNTVIIPYYTSTGSDNEGAKRIYQAALPGYTITGVNSDSSIVQGGSIHCITKEIPAVP